jgi:hypothetical protein
MRISNKHANVQMAQYHDFRGGLNTTYSVEMIAENELAIAENVEVFKGQLKTVAGTDTVIHDEDKTFAYIIYDSINKALLVTDNEQNVYRVNNGELVALAHLQAMRLWNMLHGKTGLLSLLVVSYSIITAPI